MLVVPALGRVRQEGHKLKGSLSCIGRDGLKQSEDKQNRTKQSHRIEVIQNNNFLLLQESHSECFHDHSFNYSLFILSFLEFIEKNVQI
jgi:hypothetical protein